MRTDYSYIGSGRILVRRRNVVGAGFVEMGNCSALALAVESEVKQLRDFRAPGGGTYNRVDRITAVNVSLSAHDLSPLNLSLALYGTTTAVTGGPVTDENAVATKGSYVALTGQPSAITSVSPATGSGTDPYVAGVDYVFQHGGLWIPEGSAITAATGNTPNIKATYTQKKGSLVQALMTAAPELEFRFLGLNEADSGSSVEVNIWRAKLGPAQSIPLIGDDYAALEMTGAAMADASRPAGQSQYFQTFVEDNTL